jgi:ATP-dependent Lhr-like helicase
LLSGRAWTVLAVRHDDRRVLVAPAPRGRQPTWGGYLPQFLGHTLCQRMLEVVTCETDYPYLTQPARAALAERRAALGDVLSPRMGGIELDGGEVRWWTYAGGTINSTLRFAIRQVCPDWAVSADNLLVRVRGEGLAGTAFTDTLSTLGRRAFWDDDALWAEVAGSLPSYRLSKFQPLMPPWIERETLARFLLDAPATWDWLVGCCPVPHADRRASG